MRRSLLCVSILLAAVAAGPASGQSSSVPAFPSASPRTGYDLVSFQAELHRLDGLLQKKPSTNELAALRDALPRQWNVTSSGHTYSISTQPLRNQLTALSSDKARIWVETLSEEVERSSQESETTPSKAKSELDAILAEPQFSSVRQPGAWELLRRRIVAWLAQMLLKLFGTFARYPLGGQILFWLVVAAGVLVVGLFVFRFIAARSRIAVLPPSSSVFASRTWQEWIRAAREAARRGDFREAVHSSYWAGIVRLQDSGALPADRTKTPREYLRLVREPRPSELAASPVLRQPLADLTLRLERAWYADRGAGPEDFHESLRQLEALGCQLD